jgi:prenyltransferase beta subunit
MRYVIYFEVAVFMVSLLVSIVIVQADAQIFTETERSALINSLPKQSTDATSTAQILRALDALDGLGSVDVEKELNYIISEQTAGTENKTLCWPSLVNSKLYNELYAPYVITTLLRRFNAENRANRTAILNLVMHRYNQTDGAFHELPFEQYRGTPWALCNFPIDTQATVDGGWADSNVISTFLAVSILANLNALEEINVTKTVNWIMSCKANNGGFGPTPAGDWGSINEKGWYLDEWTITKGNTSGIPYTYAALSALRVLGVNVTRVVNEEMLGNYIMSCEKISPDGEVEFGWLYSSITGEKEIDTDFFSTYYAVMLLNQFVSVENGTLAVSGVVAHIKSLEDNAVLNFSRSWPIPQRDSSYGFFPAYYGVYPTEWFTDAYWAADDAYFACSILNATNNLNILDKPTPIVSTTLYDLLALSALICVSAYVLYVVGAQVYRTGKEREKKEQASRDSAALKKEGLFAFFE